MGALEWLTGRLGVGWRGRFLLSSGATVPYISEWHMVWERVLTNPTSPAGMSGGQPGSSLGASAG